MAIPLAVPEHKCGSNCFSLLEFLIPSTQNTFPDQTCTSLQAWNVPTPPIGWCLPSLGPLAQAPCSQSRCHWVWSSCLPWSVSPNPTGLSLVRSKTSPRAVLHRRSYTNIFQWMILVSKARISMGGLTEERWVPIDQWPRIALLPLCEITVSGPSCWCLSRFIQLHDVLTMLW